MRAALKRQQYLRAFIAVKEGVWNEGALSLAERIRPMLARQSGPESQQAGRYRIGSPLKAALDPLAKTGGQRIALEERGIWSVCRVMLSKISRQNRTLISALPSVHSESRP